MEKDTKKEVLKVSAVLGCALLVFVLLGNGLTALVRYFFDNAILTKTFNVSCYLQILYSILAILLPFFIATFVIRKMQGRPRTDLLPLGPPKNYILFLCALGIGFMAIMISNTLTSLFVVTMKDHGFVFDGADAPIPKSASGYFWAIMADAFVPALCEEYALRGVVMGSLRKYGDSMAIGFSALLFALMHGNMTQAPFAFLLGLVIGRLVIATDSLWTGIAIHFLNNFFAVLMQIMQNHTTTVTVAATTVIAATVALVMGIISIFVLREVYHWKEREPLRNPGTTKVEKRHNRWWAEGLTVVSPPMLVSLAYLFYVLVTTVHHKGG